MHTKQLLFSIFLKKENRQGGRQGRYTKFEEAIQWPVVLSVPWCRRQLGVCNCSYQEGFAASGDGHLNFDSLKNQNDMWNRNDRKPSEPLLWCNNEFEETTRPACTLRKGNDDSVCATEATRRNLHHQKVVAWISWAWKMQWHVTGMTKLLCEAILRYNEWETTRRRDPHSEKPENNKPACTPWRGNNDSIGCVQLQLPEGGGSLDFVSLKNAMACDRNDKIALWDNSQIQILSEFQEPTTNKSHTHTFLRSIIWERQIKNL